MELRSLVTIALYYASPVPYQAFDSFQNSLQFFFFFQFFSPIIFISWRLITLQYCSGFCHTLTWISHGFTCVPHPEPPPTYLPIPSPWVFPVHQPWAPVSCIQPGLMICFTLDNIHVSVLSLRSQFFCIYCSTWVSELGRREGGSGWGTHVNPWLIHVNVW